MRAGLLRHRLIIQKPVNAQNTFGEIETDKDDSADWTTYKTVWASVLPIASRSEEKLGQQNSQLLAEVDYQIEIRYLAGVTHQMRGKLGTRIFDFSTVLDPDGRKRTMYIFCKEQPNVS
jgi:SPP1 family predicted phage head-tail adaptor